jgi:MFS transporter, FSR family, fosmidomycin resistance protein
LSSIKAATFPPGSSRRNETWQIAVVSAAHFVSHYYIMLLPPLFVFVRADYAVSYTELGLALVAFNVVTALLQTPAGFLVDRIGARPLLIAGLALGGAAVAVAALVDSFWVFVAMFAVAGLANTVYHPADYTILSHRVSPERIGHAFAVHTFAGMLGGAAAPGSLLLMQASVGWRGALLGAAVLGFATAAILALSRDAGSERPASDKAHAAGPATAELTGWRLLLSRTILQNLLFFILLTLANGGLQFYSVVALGALYGTPLAVANTALSGFLLLSAVGVLAGGLVAGRTSRHSLVAALGLAGGGVVALVIGFQDPGALALITLMSLAGFLQGIIMPSRDLIVRESTPPGSFGKVFGFVTTGFNIGGIIGPFVFGFLLDHGSPRGIFLFVAAASLLAVFAAMTVARPRAPAAAMA